MLETPVQKDHKLSAMAEGLVGSEIIKLAGEVKAMIAKGEKVHNLTIGDFNPDIFPIPQELKEEIIKAYTDNHTNYPAANGIPELRKAVSNYIDKRENLRYSPDEILISGGARPLIYAAYQAIVDPGDTVLFPVPSWNNNHYTHLTHAKHVMIETTAENKFMPTVNEIKPHIESANFIAVCSPLNPTGTTFRKEDLQNLCDLIIKENNRRGADEKPVYLLYDQIYWMLTFGETEHYNPVSLRPEMRDYTVFIDGMSKAFSATGVRVGWAFGPQKLMNKMKAILSHVGAWSPKAEQVASANYLNQIDNVSNFVTEIKSKIDARLNACYDGFKSLNNKGYKVDAIAPEAAMYLTVKFDLKGKTTPEGKTLTSTEDVTDYILKVGKLAIVPFYAFGADRNSSWYRLSVGTLSMEAVEEIFVNLESALSKLS